MEEYVVLVNDRNEVIGTAEKLITHNAHTPLHRGISVFLFNKEGDLLLQQRSHKKKTWPLVWSNSCCGHPKLDEVSAATAKRRLSYELEITYADITVILPDYRYRFEREGIVENEFCPVMVAFTTQLPTVNADEVEAVKWISWAAWLHEVRNKPREYSEWCVEETKLLDKSIEFHRLLQDATKKLASK